MRLFKCKHSAKNLFVKKDSTIEPIDSEFNHITYHLYCNKCGEDVDIRYAQMIGGVNKFLGEKLRIVK